MPSYEVLTEKSTVVLDIGNAYTKFGFSGEFAPRHIIPTEVLCKKEKQIRKVFAYKSEKDLFDLLVEFIHLIYFKYALISPKDRPIVIVESLLCPTLFRETLAKVLFSHYEMSMVFAVPSHLVSLSPLAVESALVLDVGYSEAVALPVCHGLPIIHAWEALPLGGKTIMMKLHNLLSLENTGTQTLSESAIEDILVRCCFLTKMDRAQQLQKPKPCITACPDIVYPLGGDQQLIVSGKVRELSCELFFEEDNDHLCLATMILDSLLKVNVDLRKILSENIILIGGMTMIPGFKARLKEELLRQLKLERYKKLNINGFKFHNPPCKENYTAWLGGAIYGATELLGMKAVTRENYFKESRLPDWVNMRDNIRSC